MNPFRWFAKKANGEPAAFVFGLANLVVALWLTYCRGASFEISFGPEVLLQGYQTIGVTCIFRNKGGRPGTISRLVAELDGVRLRPVRVSVGSDLSRWKNGREVIVDLVSYEKPSPISVEAGRAETRTVWFFLPKKTQLARVANTLKRRLVISAFTEPHEIVASKDLRFSVGASALECLDRSEAAFRASAKPEATNAVEPLPQGKQTALKPPSPTRTPTYRSECAVDVLP